MTNADNCCCIDPTKTALNSILNQDRAIFERLAQLVQALGDQATGSLAVSNVSCTSDETLLWAGILAQREANFDRLQQVLDAF